MPFSCTQVAFFLVETGQTDTRSSGLPPYHPLVTEQGFDPAVVNENLRRDAADIVKAGYNLRGMCANKTIQRRSSHY